MATRKSRRAKKWRAAVSTPVCWKRPNLRSNSVRFQQTIPLTSNRVQISLGTSRSRSRGAMMQTNKPFAAQARTQHDAPDGYDRQAELQRHVRDYRRFVSALRTVIVIAALTLAGMAYVLV